MKIKKIKLSEYFQIVKPKYVILQIIPDTSIRNYNSEIITKGITYMYKSLKRRIYKDSFSKKITYETQMKTGFMIDIKKDNVNFYFIAPEKYKNLIKEKCTETWSKVSIKEVDTIDSFTNNACIYQLRYTKEDALSLRVDKRCNDPLNNILNVIDIMEENDRVGIFYNFLPCSQKPWITEYDNTIEKYKNNLPVDKERGIAYALKFSILGLCSLLSELMSSMSNILSSKKDERLDEVLVTRIQDILVNNKKKLESNTVQKRNLGILKTQIVVLSEGKNKVNNALSVCESYRVLDEDNKLTYSEVIKYKKKNKNKGSNKDNKDNNIIDLYKDKIKNISINKMSTQECKNLIELPGRNLLNLHQNIDKIDVLESPVPNELQNGNIRLGNVDYKGKKYSSYLPKDYDKASLPLVLLSAQGGGKTTLICNIAMDAIKNGEGIIDIDFIKNCEVCTALEAVTPKDKLVIIDCSDINNLQGFGYNEFSMKDNITDMERLDIANSQAQQIITFINCINVDDDGKGLTGQMKRYLRAAANITFFYGKKNIGDVIECLEDYTVRVDYMNYICSCDDSVKGVLKSELNALDELNEKDKDGNVVGSKGTVALKGIFDRIDDLQSDIRLKIMFNKDCSNNINFVDCVNEGKVVLIKIPEDVFFDTTIKDLLTTFFCTKIILSAKLRSKVIKPKMVNVIIDEVSQTETAESWIKKTLSQTRKFGIKYIFALHYMNQLKYNLDDELKGCGSSFILLKGCNKINYNEFKEELEPYQLEDLLNLKQFHALNLININDGWSKFITELPSEPIELKKVRREGAK